MFAKLKACITCSSTTNTDDKAATSNRDGVAGKEPGPAGLQQQNAPMPSNKAGGDAAAQDKSPQVEEQQRRQTVDPAKEGPAAAQGQAQKALQAAKEKPQTSTDPDAGATLPIMIIADA